MLTNNEQKALAINEAIKKAGPPTGYPQQIIDGFTLRIWQTEEGPAWYCVEAGPYHAENLQSALKKISQS